MSATSGCIVDLANLQAGRFVDARTTPDKKHMEVTVKCGHCDQPTSASVPREEYHVVTVGQAVGIFTSGAVADTLINGVEGFARRKVYSWSEAVEVFKFAMDAGSIQIKPAKEK
ncbi:hypothetical protein MD484_g5797, partial [Candolleomyces efflorescens]